MNDLGNGQFRVRFSEGEMDEGTIMHDALSVIVPRVGEMVTLRTPDRRQSRFVVVNVDHIYDLSNVGISPTNDLTGVWVQIRSASSSYSLENL